MIVLATIRQFLDSLLHPSAQRDALTRARHQAFMAPRLLGGLAALAMGPLYLAWRGAPSALEVMVFGWLIVPILLTFFLSRTGRYEIAHVLSSLALTSLVTVVALETGGIESFAAIWLVMVPLEAALSASRRVVAVATVLALGSAMLLLVLSANNLVPVAMASETRQGPFMALGIISATLYGAGLAFGAESLARTSFWLLCAEEDRYRLLARNMSDVISRHDRNGTVLFISPAAEALFGAPAASLLGHGLFERVHVADRPAFLTALADAAQVVPDRGESGVEFRVRRDPPGCGEPARRRMPPAYIWIEMRCRPLVGVDGEAVDGADVVAVMRDVTARKVQEQALCDAQAEAERANAAKGRFLATMSHELRTPLNAIIGFSDMLRREDEIKFDAARRNEYAALIHDSGQHLLSVVNDILDMSKIESGAFEISSEPFSPREAIFTCCDLMALKARENGIDLNVRVPEDMPRMRGDKRAFRQVLLNLLSNAVKFTERGGTVTVAATIEGARIVLRVEDTGVGIGAEDMARLGDPFFQAGTTYQRRHEGTGLGLSIVRGLVALHEGELNFYSKIGEGTRVTVTLPLEFEPQAPVELARISRLASAPAAGAELQVRKRA
ncbi:MAG: PAS domain S-box protein [Xanthobacteraceae bacterium]|nr:MAG: PAS domain S-box protein [Xanthobacteraceae bacterium]